MKQPLFWPAVARSFQVRLSRDRSAMAWTVLTRRAALREQDARAVHRRAQPTHPIPEPGRARRSIGWSCRQAGLASRRAENGEAAAENSRESGTGAAHPGEQARAVIARGDHVGLAQVGRDRIAGAGQGGAARSCS